MENQIEVWKDVPNYNGVYQVSNLGNVRSFKKNKVKILKQKKLNSGYLSAVLFLKIRKYYSVHQLVAMAFLNHTPCGFKLVVNHKNFIKTDNRLENLEVITHRQNTNRMHLKSKSKYVGVQWSGITNKFRSVISINGKDKVLGQFDCEKEASEYYQNALLSLEKGEEIKVKKAVFSSKYKGVTYCKTRKKWVSRIKINNKFIFVGYFNTEIEAKNSLINFKK